MFFLQRRSLTLAFALSLTITARSPRFIDQGDELQHGVHGLFGRADGQFRSKDPGGGPSDRRLTRVPEQGWLGKPGRLHPIVWYRKSELHLVQFQQGLLCERWLDAHPKG